MNKKSTLLQSIVIAFILLILPDFVSALSAPVSTKAFKPVTVFQKGGSLQDITCQNKICVAVGNTNAGASQIVRSTDSGKTWSIVLAKKFVKTSGGPSLVSVSCKDNLCLTVGGGGIILRSIDSGKTWVFQKNILSIANTDYYPSDFFSVSCATDKICYAVGENYFSGGVTPDYYKALGGFILQTNDGGVTWNTVNNIKPSIGVDNLFPKKIVCKNSLECFGTAYPFYVLHTIDGWKTIDSKRLSNNFGDFSSIILNGNTIMLANGDQSRLLYRSTDNGATWSNITVPQSTKNFGGSIGCINQDCVLVFQNLPSSRVDILNSKDGGLTWATSVYNKKASIYGVGCISNSCFAVGDLAPVGIIIKVK